MRELQTFSTAGMTPRQRLDAWNGLAGVTCTPIVTDPMDLRTFAPSLTRTKLGDLALVQVSSSPAFVYHTKAHVARVREPLFFLHVQLEGTSCNRQDGKEALLQPGDVTVFDNTRPFQMVFEADNKVLVVGIPAQLLRKQLGSPESIVAIRMAYENNLSRMLSDFARGVWAQCSLEIDSMAPSLVCALMHLLGCVFGPVLQAAPQASGTRVARRLHILNLIEAHLSDPDLSPVKIASMLRTSPRYLHMLFTEGSETLSRYILRRRLEESARALKSPSQRPRTISDIAIDFGFSSCTHFGKVFREHYGLTPREYRHQISASNDESAGTTVATLRRRGSGVA